MGILALHEFAINEVIITNYLCISTITQQITLFPVILLTFFFHITHASSVKVVGSKNNIFNFNLIYFIYYIIMS